MGFARRIVISPSGVRYGRTKFSTRGTEVRRFESGTGRSTVPVLVLYLATGTCRYRYLCKNCFGYNEDSCVRSRTSTNPDTKFRQILQPLRILIQRSRTCREKKVACTAVCTRRFSAQFSLPRFENKRATKKQSVKFIWTMSR